ncbi:hypothetical protein EUGRSUZ_J01809 [Eucalyptus grandis]|uniref:Uncharacterized protein n=2 Tax=Eucalyptus grandis TaxID=71139 RepID=A0ACC3J6S2_EUCGR|nr:hypothetical protein EUGRSUZ_J01809 [Eucalyptus grandis]
MRQRRWSLMRFPARPRHSFRLPITVTPSTQEQFGYKGIDDSNLERPKRESSKVDGLVGPLREEKLHTQINFNSIPKQHHVIIIEKTSVLNSNRIVLLIPTNNSHRFPSTQFISHKQEVRI